MENNSYEEKNKVARFIVEGSPTSWLSVGEELMDAAEIIWEYNNGIQRSETIHTDEEILEQRMISSISRPYFLLAGFAIENVLKGIIVYDDPTTINTGKLKYIKTHKITQLINEITVIELDAKELELFKNIEEAIPYWGRYPIPLKSSGMTPDIGITSERRKLIKNMYKRLALHLYKKTRKGWKSGTGEYTRIRIPEYDELLD